MKRVSMAKTPSSVCGLISPPALVTMKVRPWLIVMPGGATLISIGIVLSLGDHQGCPFMLCCLDEAQDGSGWGAIAPLDPQRKADEFVRSRHYVGKVETLDDPNSGFKQSVVGLDPIFEETADREVIHADGLHFLYRKVACRFLRNVDKVLNKVVRLPAPGRVPCPEEDPFAALKLIGTEFFRFDGLRVAYLDHTRPPNGSGERHGIYALACAKEVERRIFLCYGMGDHRELRDVGH